MERAAAGGGGQPCAVKLVKDFPHFRRQRDALDRANPRETLATEHEICPDQ